MFLVFAIVLICGYIWCLFKYEIYSVFKSNKFKAIKYKVEG